MRAAHASEIAVFMARLADLARLAEGSMNRATTALVAADPSLAASVVSEKESITALHLRLDEQAVGILARERPDAAQVRTIVAGLRMGADLERMGAMARNVADLVVRRHPRAPLPRALRPTVAAIGETAQRLVAKARAAMANPDPDAAADLDRDDDEMDRLVDTLYRELLRSETNLDVETVLELTLIGRYYERYADRAVSLARRVTFQTAAR